MRILGYALLGLLMVTGAARAADKPAEKPEKAEKAEKAADTNGALAHLDFREVIRGAKDKVFPAVVYIKCLQENMESGRKVSVEVAGSGVLISAKGEVLTNWHVVEKAADVRCLLLDGRAMDAKVVGSDKDTDLALLQLQLPKDASPLPYAALGDSDRLKEGDFVMAMGAVGPQPLGFHGHHFVRAAVPAGPQPVQPVASDRRLDQPGQFGRSARQYGGRGRRGEHAGDSLRRRRGLCRAVEHHPPHRFADSHVGQGGLELDGPAASAAEGL
jgi:hypothetical protein